MAARRIRRTRCARRPPVSAAHQRSGAGLSGSASCRARWRARRRQSTQSDAGRLACDDHGGSAGGAVERIRRPRRRAAIRSSRARRGRWEAKSARDGTSPPHSISTGSSRTPPHRVAAGAGRGDRQPRKRGFRRPSCSPTTTSVASTFPGKRARVAVPFSGGSTSAAGDDGSRGGWSSRARARRTRICSATPAGHGLLA
jgi:hypothetical protein